jgi:hypothetical protein
VFTDRESAVRQNKRTPKNKETAMPLSAPPLPPPRVALADDDRNRFWLRHGLLVQSGLTILVSAWFVSLGPIPGILALVVAKEILVALLVTGLGLGQQPVCGGGPGYS